MTKEETRAVAAEFAEHLREHQSRLYGYIHALVGDVNDADDLFQQTTVILWKKFGDFDRRRSFFAWACGIARLEAANFARQLLHLPRRRQGEEQTVAGQPRRRAHGRRARARGVARMRRRTSTS